MTTPTYATRPVSTTFPNEDLDYQYLVDAVRRALADLPYGTVLFDTAAPFVLGMYRRTPPSRFDLFLENIPLSRRQHYDCRHCRDFVNKYGGMVTIAADGTRRSPLWSLRILGSMFDPGALQTAVESSAVTGVLYRHAEDGGRRGSRWSTANGWLGEQNTRTPKASGGQFHHLCTQLPNGVTLPQYDKAAAVREDRGVLARSLAEYGRQAALAKDLLAGDKHGPMAEWFYQVYQSVEGGRPGSVPSHRKDALLWRAAAAAPTGFCHVRSTVLGTVLEDLKQGVPMATLRRKYLEKTAPLAYQRPQAAPTAGAIDRAEKIFEEMGLAPSLVRRYATMDDVPIHGQVWTAAGPAGAPWRGVAGRGTDPAVFAHLRPAEAWRTRHDAAGHVPERVVTWRHFKETVLPTTATLEYLTPTNTGNFFAFVTAQHPEAPCLFRWHHHVNWYLYHGGSEARRWGLGSMVWIPVLAVVNAPDTWRPDRDIPATARATSPSLGEGAYLILEGAKDFRPTNPGLALFPEEMRGELREVRSVIEAASKAGRILDAPGQHAAGVCYQKTTEPGSRFSLALRATSSASGLVSLYRVDRWE